MYYVLQSVSLVVPEDIPPGSWLCKRKKDLHRNAIEFRWCECESDMFG